jgi:hypothetical protein
LVDERVLHARGHMEWRFRCSMGYMAST